MLVSTHVLHKHLGCDQRELIDHSTASLRILRGTHHAYGTSIHDERRIDVDPLIYPMAKVRTGKDEKA